MTSEDHLAVSALTAQEQTLLPVFNNTVVEVACIKTAILPMIFKDHFTEIISNMPDQDDRRMGVVALVEV